MKSLAVIFVALLGVALAGCGSFSFRENRGVADFHPDPSALSAFLAAAEEAATDLPRADGPSEWQREYDNVKYMSKLLPDESLTDAQWKECDGIVNQMEFGKLALEMKRVDPKTGLKQCKLVSADITKRVKKIKAIKDTADKMQVAHRSHIADWLHF